MLRNSSLLSYQSYIVLDVWSAALLEQNSTSLIVTMLTSNVKCSEPAPVLDVDIGVVVTEQSHCPAPASPSCQVERGHSVNLVLVVHTSSSIKQHLHDVVVSSSSCQL